MQIHAPQTPTFPSTYGTAPQRPQSKVDSPADGFSSSSPETDYPFLLDKDWERAGELMTEHGVALQDHSLMRENIATYLAHCPQGKSMPVGRWDNKLQKDLSAPYSDAEVMGKVDNLQRSLAENLSALPEYPKEIYLTGSFAKARLRAQSDLNGYAPVTPDNFQPSFNLFKNRFQDNKAAKIFPFSDSQPSFNKGMLMVDGASVKISTDKLKDPGYLKSVYADLLKERKSQRFESTPKMDLWFGKAWRSKYERAPLHYRAMRLAVSMCGALTRLPLLGGTAESLMGRAIRQNHRDLTS